MNEKNARFTDEKKKHDRLYSKEEYAALTRDGMYQALLYASPTLARGKSRATKEILIDAYAQAAATDSIPVVRVEKNDVGELTAALVPSVDEPQPHADPEKLKEVFDSIDSSLHAAHTQPQDIKHVDDVDPAFEVLASKVDEKLAQAQPPIDHAVETVDQFVTEGADYPAIEARMASLLGEPATVSAPHVHGPECDHGRDHDQPLPKLVGLAELNEYVRVNPDMPELVDGSVIQLPPDEERMFTFRDGVERPLSEKQQRLIVDLKRYFDDFRRNPADNTAKRTTMSVIYALKVTGIAVNPRFIETIREGRAYVRDVRRKMKAGVDVSAVAQEIKEEERLKQAVNSSAQST